MTTVRTATYVALVGACHLPTLKGKSWPLAANAGFRRASGATTTSKYEIACTRPRPERTHQSRVKRTMPPSRSKSELLETVRIAGQDYRLERRSIPLELIDLDPENPRIGMPADAKPSGEPLTQPEAEHFLRVQAPEAFDHLKLSIESNKGVMNPIWVKKSGTKRFVVVEGNTRVLVYKDLSKKYLMDPNYRSIPARVLPDDLDSKVAHWIRVEAHLRGVTPWDAYERARYLWYLYDREGYPKSTLVNITRLGDREISHLIEAYRTMTEHYLPSHPDPNEVLKFSFFVEYHSKAGIRDAIERHGFSVDDLCDWIGTKRLRRAQDIRDLPLLLENKEVREEFLAKGYEDAMSALEYIKPARASTKFKLVARVIEEIDTMPSFEITEIRSAKGGTKLVLLRKLRESVDGLLELVEPRGRVRKGS